MAFVWGIHRGPVNSPHKWPVTRKMFPFDDVIMNFQRWNKKLEESAQKFIDKCPDYHDDNAERAKAAGKCISIISAWLR